MDWLLLVSDLDHSINLTMIANLTVSTNITRITWFVPVIAQVFFSYLINSVVDNAKRYTFYYFPWLLLGQVGPCAFDEGTPLLQKANYGGVPETIVVGIMSKNRGCADNTVPSIYTRLAAYYAWLLQTAGQQPAPSR